ncbi:MAG: AAA family ATPase [Fimbriimonadaceae bacterium]
MVSFDEIERLAREAAVPVRAEGLLPLVRVCDLPDEPEPVDWVCEGLLIRGEATLLVSRPKVGKSTLARHLASCVLEGRPFLGRPCARGPVVLALAEEIRGYVRECFRRSGAAWSPDLHLVDLPLPPDGPSLTPETLCATARSVGAVLVVADTLQRCFPLKDPNDYAETTALLARMQQAARENGVAFLATHHSNKRAGEHDDHALGVMGSNGLFGAATVLATMGRDERGVWLHTEGRYGRNIPRTYVRLIEDTQSLEALGTSEEVRGREAREEILRAVEESPGIARSDLLDRVGGKRSVSNRALEELVREGLIVRSGDGQRGSPYTFRLPGLEKEEEDDAQGRLLAG